MLKLSIKAGEYLLIGENVKLIFTGGTGNNMHILVEAPKSVSVVRSRAAERAGEVPPQTYRKETDISEDARRQIRSILKKERERAAQR